MPQSRSMRLGVFTTVCTHHTKDPLCLSDDCLNSKPEAIGTDDVEGVPDLTDGPAAASWPTSTNVSRRWPQGADGCRPTCDGPGSGRVRRVTTVVIRWRPCKGE